MRFVAINVAITPPLPLIYLHVANIAIYKDKRAKPGTSKKQMQRNYLPEKLITLTF
jgi:hypothetical protein